MTADLTYSQWDALPCTTHGRYHVPHVLPLDPATAPTPDARIVALAPANPRNADVLQAQLFIELLEDELADLQSQLARTARRARAAKHLGTVQVRIDEVVALLDALARRFPVA
jgi:hypothetical protein